MHQQQEIAEDSFDSWLSRGRRVVKAYKLGQLNAEELAPYQHFILNFGQFNANYTFAELKHLGYPISPFLMMHRHTYVRSAETWATCVLREQFRLANPSASHLHPLFVDSPEIVDELARYYHVVSSESILNATENEKALLSFLTKKGKCSTLIQLASPDSKEMVDDCIANALLSKAMEKSIPAELHELFTIPPEKYEEEDKKRLHDCIGSQLSVIQARRKNVLAKKRQKFGERKQNYGKIYGHIKSSGEAGFLKKNNIASKEDLEGFAIKNVQEFESICVNLKVDLNLQEDGMPDYFYRDAINLWRNQIIESMTNQLIYFWVPDEAFHDIDTVVFVDHPAAEEREGWGPKALINRLGFRVEPSRAIDAVLACFPLLFVDENQTNDFWKCLTGTYLYCKLFKLVSNAKNVIEGVPSLIFSDSQDHNKPNFKVQFKLKCDEIDSRYVDPPLTIYHKFITRFIKQFQGKHPGNSPSYQIIAEELYTIIDEFLAAYKASPTNLAKCIRAAQTVSEMLQLHLVFCPVPEEKLLEPTIKELFFEDYPVQSVTLVPYGMRAYLKVLQASGINDTSGEKPRIYVTNQNYFECLLGLDGLPSSQAVVKRVRQLEDMDASFDILFAEIHPNNVTDRKQFSQNLAQFTKFLKEHSSEDKPRTIVFDATLNAFDDPELLT